MINIQGLTPQARTERVRDALEIRNLMGRRAFYQASGQVEAELALWAEDCVYVQNNLCLRGRETLAAALRNKAARTGQGYMEWHPLTTPLIEIAKDGGSARGFWYSLGQQGAAGGKGNWVNGRLRADFIKTEAGWRIWRLISGTDLSLEAGTDREAEPSLPCTDVLLELTEADVAGLEAERGVFYDPSFNWSPEPALPVAYDTLEELKWEVHDLG